MRGCRRYHGLVTGVGGAIENTMGLQQGVLGMYMYKISKYVLFNSSFAQFPYVQEHVNLFFCLFGSFSIYDSQTPQ